MSKNWDVKMLQHRFTNLTRVMTGKATNVRLSTTAATSSTDMTNVVIKFTTDFAGEPLSPGMSMVMGKHAVGHEAGHLRYSSKSGLDEAWSRGPLFANLVNCVEDGRIEKLMSEDYPGFKKWRGLKYKAYWEAGEKKALFTDERQASLMGICLWALTGNVFPNLPPRALTTLTAAAPYIDIGVCAASDLEVIEIVEQMLQEPDVAWLAEKPPEMPPMPQAARKPQNRKSDDQSRAEKGKQELQRRKQRQKTSQESPPDDADPQDCPGGETGESTGSGGESEGNQKEGSSGESEDTAGKSSSKDDATEESGKSSDDKEDADSEPKDDSESDSGQGSDDENEAESDDTGGESDKSGGSDEDTKKTESEEESAGSGDTEESEDNEADDGESDESSDSDSKSGQQDDSENQDDTEGSENDETDDASDDDSDDSDCSGRFDGEGSKSDDDSGHDGTAMTPEDVDGSYFEDEISSEEFGSLEELEEELKIAETESDDYYWDVDIPREPLMSRYEKDVKHTESSDTHTYRHSFDGLEPTVTELTKTLEPLFYPKKSAFRPRQYRGNIDPGSLHRVVTMQDPDIFRRKTRPGNRKDLAVAIALDASGSMNGYAGTERKWLAAGDASFCITQTMQRLGVPIKVTGYTTANKNGREIPHHLELVDWKDHNADGLLSYSAIANNDDATAFLVVGRELLNRPEKEKLMIILSDGQPNCYRTNDAELIRETAEAVMQIQRTGIKLISLYFGPKTETGHALRIYGPQLGIVNDVGELPRILVDRVKRLLVC